MGSAAGSSTLISHLSQSMPQGQASATDSWMSSILSLGSRTSLLASSRGRAVVRTPLLREVRCLGLLGHNIPPSASCTVKPSERPGVLVQVLPDPLNLSRLQRNVARVAKNELDLESVQQLILLCQVESRG
jgi:hypothetical protein